MSSDYLLSHTYPTRRSTDLPSSIRKGATSPNFSKIFAAIQARRVVEFSYRAASTGREGVRKIQPWQLFGRSGVWYVVGFDLERENRRMFRLDRRSEERRAGKTSIWDR